MEKQRRVLTKEEIDSVWQKAKVVPNNNPDIYRQDYAGAWIRRDQYGEHTEYGWEIDHIVPISKGGTNDIENLIPLQYQNNAKKADNFPHWQTQVSAQGERNEENIRNWYV